MKATSSNVALLDRDVRKAFPDDASVNEALRVILKAALNLADSLQLTSKPKKRRTQNDDAKENCRVLAMSGKRILFETRRRQARRDLRNGIISNQRRVLQNQHPELKNMTSVQYVLQWERNGRWVTDKA